MHTTAHAHSVYANLASTTAVTGANPHRLVKMLFDELGSSLAQLALAFDDPQRRARAAAKATSILIALSASLDFERGGRIADDLSAVYDYCARRVQETLRSGLREPVDEVRALIADIAEAWTAIGQ